MLEKVDELRFRHRGPLVAVVGLLAVIALLSSVWGAVSHLLLLCAAGGLLGLSLVAHALLKRPPRRRTDTAAVRLRPLHRGEKPVSVATRDASGSPSTLAALARAHGPSSEVVGVPPLPLGSEPPAIRGPLFGRIVVQPRSRARRSPSHRRVEGLVFFLVPLVVYLLVGYYLDFVWHSFFGDAQARVANASYMLYSRDPHIAAVGFVWQPLTSLSVLPLLLFKGIWPALARNLLAATIMSSLFMAIAVHQVRRSMYEMGVSTPTRIALTALFAFNPMIVFYGANGMSEALYLCCLLIGTRYFLRWFASNNVADLVAAGIAVGLAYLTRSEAALAGALGFTAAFAVSGLRTQGAANKKAMTAATEASIFVLPFAACFAGWAVASWIIVGHPFEQLQGTYGTSAMQALTRGTAIAVGDAARQAPPHVIHDILSLAPLLPLLLLIAAALVLVRRDYRPLAPLTLLGGGLLFSAATALARRSGGYYRYYIPAVPLGLLLAAGLATRPSRHQSADGPRHTLNNPPKRRPWGRPLAAAIAILLAAPAAVTAAITMPSSVYAQEESGQLVSLFHPGRPVDKGSVYFVARRVARYIDGLHLRNGSVLVDNADPCVPFLILQSDHPAQFAIPNDRDFNDLLVNPRAFNVSYILAVPNGGLGGIDAANHEYPTLYSNGAGISTLSHQFQGQDCPDFRLYRLTYPALGSKPSVTEPLPRS